MMDELTSLLDQLIAIDSVNPELVPGAPGEREITDFAATWLEARGVSVAEVACCGRGESGEVAAGSHGAEPLEASADRPSLLCHVPGTGGGRSLVLYAHTDTVGVAGMASPFTPVHRNGAVHGRGAWDMKGSLAVIMRVAAAVAARPCAGDVWLMLVADEESGSRGAEAVLRALAGRAARPDACIVAEPSGLRVMRGHRGFATGTITTYGRAGHSARRDEGVDAIAMMARVITALEDVDVRLNDGPGHPLLGHGAVLTSLVRGGSELFTYPSECEARFVWRTLPGQTQAGLTADVDEIFASLERRDPRFNATLAWQLWREPLLTDANSDIARAVARVALDELGNEPDVCAAPWWTDGALIQGAGIPVVIFGPTGGGIHATEEWVEVSGLERFETILLNTTRSFSDEPIRSGDRGGVGR